MTITPSQLKSNLRSNRILFTYIEEKGTSSEHWPWPMPSSSSSSSSWWRSWWRSWCPRPGGGRWLLRVAPNSRCLPLGRRVSRHRHHNSHPLSSLPFFRNEQLAIVYCIWLGPFWKRPKDLHFDERWCLIPTILIWYFSSCWTIQDLFMSMIGLSSMKQIRSSVAPTRL